MPNVRYLVALLALFAISSTARAFQEQKASTPQQEQSAEIVAPLSPDAPVAGKGTPVRIPGLGTLGVIPKMDFGLELLYGAAETSTKRPDPNKQDLDDVLVGGRIKHKF